MMCVASTAIPLCASSARPVSAVRRTSYPESNQSASSALYDQEQRRQEYGQAYYAAAYTPSLRPCVIVGLALAAAILVVCLTNK